MGEIEYITRYVLSVLAIAVLLNCVISLIRLRPKKKVYALFRDLATKEEYEMACYETSIGRARSNDITFKLPSVSRSHAVVALRKDGFYIFDTESKQGVYVNGEKIEGTQKLNNGDTVAFGMAIMKFYIASVANGDIKQDGNEHKEYSLINTIDGSEFYLEGDYVTIGRQKGSNIEITASNVSRKQAVISNNNGNWYIQSFGSVIPTIINGEEVLKPTLLHVGDVITIGDFAFLFDEREEV